MGMAGSRSEFRLLRSRCSSITRAKVESFSKLIRCLRVVDWARRPILDDLPEGRKTTRRLQIGQQCRLVAGDCDAPLAARLGAIERLVGGGENRRARRG